MNKPLSGRCILVVEDEMLVLIDIEDMLADLGCRRIFSAATFEQALALIEMQAFDAVMLDMNLNGVRSNGLADALAARGVPFVIATGYSAQDIDEGYRQRPMVKKPFLMEDLTKAGLVV
jgi:CheY-like chemotaxis protein